jgi:hypothetical protein
MRRAKKHKNASSARHYDQIRFRFHTAWVISGHGDNSARCPLLPQQRPLAAYLISLLSEHGFPVMPKSFPVNFHREYRKKPLWMLHKTMASSLPHAKFCDFPC